MLSYAPFEEPPAPVRRTPPIVKKSIVMPNETECSYLVMFFIVGTIVLALTDMK